MDTKLFCEDSRRKNFLVINCLNGYIEVTHDAKTDEEIDDDGTLDYSDAISMGLLEVGESFRIADGSCIVVRVS